MITTKNLEFLDEFNVFADEQLLDSIFDHGELIQSWNSGEGRGSTEFELWKHNEQYYVRRECYMIDDQWAVSYFSVNIK